MLCPFAYMRNDHSFAFFWITTFHGKSISFEQSLIWIWGHQLPFHLALLTGFSPFCTSRAVLVHWGCCNKAPALVICWYLKQQQCISHSSGGRKSDVGYQRGQVVRAVIWVLISRCLYPRGKDRWRPLLRTLYKGQSRSEGFHPPHLITSQVPHVMLYARFTSIQQNLKPKRQNKKLWIGPSLLLPSWWPCLPLNWWKENMGF